MNTTTKLHRSDIHIGFEDELQEDAPDLIEQIRTEIHNRAETLRIAKGDPELSLSISGDE